MFFAVDGFHTQITDVLFLFDSVAFAIRHVLKHFPSGGILQKFDQI